jgi:PhzF family phenazine biosynthesis protein
LWLEAAGQLASAATAGLRQEIAGQVLPVEVVRERSQPAAVWMDQPPPHFGQVAGDRARLAACLGLGEQDLLPREDAQVVSTGAGHRLVLAQDRGAVDRAVPDPARLVPMLAQAGAEGCYLYSPDPVDATGAVAYARFFNPAVGIAEDLATGIAAGPKRQRPKERYAADCGALSYTGGLKITAANDNSVTLGGWMKHRSLRLVQSTRFWYC